MYYRDGLRQLRLRTRDPPGALATRGVTDDAINNGYVVFPGPEPDGRLVPDFVHRTITNVRDNDWPPEVVGERVDATAETIRLHYDLPDEIRRMQSHRKYLEGD